jgi:hypothetical protein
VLLHIGTGPSAIEEGAGTSVVVTGTNRFILTEDLWIERLDEETAKNIQRACELPHYRIDNFLYDRHLYAFVRRASGNETDPGAEELFAVAALSRLIHPTTIGGRYCAKVFHFGMKDSPIQAVVFGGLSPDAVLSSKQRDWLSVEDGDNLRRLMPWLRKDKPMHQRIHGAYWNHEYAMRSLYLDSRWLLVVSGLETLINIRDSENKRQFWGRVRQLAMEFSVDLGDRDLARAYKLRSKLAHGQGFLQGLGTILPRSEH